MNRICGIPILIFCFSLSSLQPCLATQTVEVPAVIVQPYDSGELRELNQKMMAQDRINRDQEMAIKGLADDNER